MYILETNSRSSQVSVRFGNHLDNHWQLLAGGRCLEVDLALTLFGRNLAWSMSTVGRYSRVVVITGLTVYDLLKKSLSFGSNIKLQNFKSKK